jgi:tRNA A37 N6-isopentenylltransferase MiaA
MIFKLGWLDEARALLGTHWEEFIIKKGFVGYADIFSWLRAGQDPATLPELVSLIVTKTRQYAKRQETFLKKLMTELAEHQGQNLYLLTIDSSSPQSVIKAAAMARINQ